ncbi:MAG TPA: CsgG/HfaB family protein, partial [Ilumatobacter sp.]|nr:CsgG/HfaB family protein [Ilumatobacter sp.]
MAPFSVDGVDTALAPLAYALADLLMTDLARSAQLRIVDRLRLDALLREVRLVEAGRVDTATAPRVGRLVGARRLVIGALAA